MGDLIEDAEEWEDIEDIAEELEEVEKEEEEKIPEPVIAPPPPKKKKKKKKIRELNLKCPQCSESFDVKIIGLTTFNCPSCGLSGKIE